MAMLFLLCLFWTSQNWHNTCTSRCFGVIFLYNLTGNFYSTWSDGFHPSGHQCCDPSLLCRTLFFSGLDACLFMGRLKWNGANSHKLANWMRILLTFFLATASWMLAIIKTEFSCCFQKCGRNSGYRFWYHCLPGVWADYYILICTQCCELLKAVGSNGK
jgi:hypothetical protein